MNFWSNKVQSPKLLYETRISRFNDSNKDEWLRLLGIKDGDKVLEIGCGCGAFCMQIKKYLPHCSVTGIDYDRNFINFARKKNEEENLGISFIEANLKKLPFKAESFDIIFSYTVIEHLPIKVFLAEQLRVLKKGGLLVAQTVLPQFQVGSGYHDEKEKEISLKTKLFKAQSPVVVKNHLLPVSEYMSAFEKEGLEKCSFDFDSILWFAPDNDGEDKEKVIRQIESLKDVDLEMVKMQQKIKKTLSEEEYREIQMLIKRRFTKRRKEFERGNKKWDFYTTFVLSLKGHKK